MQACKDESRYCDSDEIAFKLTLRLDGKSADTTATKLRDGTNTAAAFVIVETRQPWPRSSSAGRTRAAGARVDRDAARLFGGGRAPARRR
jgi:hypothetical protein